MKLKAILYAAGLMGCALAGSSPAASAPSPMLKVLSRIDGPDGGWDYASFDAVHRKLYVARNTSVMVIDVDKGKVEAPISSGSHLHAVLPIPGSNLLVTTDSGDQVVRILRAPDGRTLATIPTPEDTDGAVYDAQSGLVLVICGDAGDIVVVDPKAKTSEGVIKIGTPLEFGAVDGAGHFFVNESDKNAVAEVDLKTRKVMATWPLEACKGPTGLAYALGQIVSVCGNGQADILDARNGRSLASLKIGGFPDAVIYDPRLQTAYVPSAISGTLAAIPLAGPAKDKILETITTQTGARTGAMDPTTGRLYLPTAQYNIPTSAGKRPEPKPGTFQVLVVGSK